MESAVILAGAVAKGAFEAGALQVLAERGIVFRRIVSASAGSLNGLVFSLGQRTGRGKEVADHLVELWRDRARWQRVFQLSLGGIFTMRGLSTGNKVQALLAEEMERWLDGYDGPRHEVELRMVVALLDGAPSTTGPTAATTFEQVVSFRGEQLDDPAQREKIILTASASAAFPGAFLPINLEGIGWAVDGGTVNNTPIKEAVEGTAVHRVFLVEPHPAVMPPAETLSGGNLIMRMVDILIHERLFRDLREAYHVNQSLEALEALELDGTLTRAQLKKVKEAMRLHHARPLAIIPIRPEAPLEGNSFTGFFNRELREKYIAEGRAAAERALKDHGVLGAVLASAPAVRAS